MSQVRVLIVDDSLIVREILNSMLSADPEIEVIGSAENGKEGIKLARELKPDFITMDLNMPVMNGMEAIEEIMIDNPTPILVISSMSDSKIAFDACSKGALDVFPKEDVNPDNTVKLTEKVKVLVSNKAIGYVKPKIISTPSLGGGSTEQLVIAIAGSTGGPVALSSLLAEIPPCFPHTILVSQHLESAFLRGLITSLNQVSPIKVECGVNGQKVEGSRIFISPSEMHMLTDESGNLEFIDPQPSDKYHPCCDFLLASVAETYGRKSIGVILSGIGDDGVHGIQEIKAQGGLTIAQDEETSVAYGMNRLAIENGSIKEILPPHEIGRLLANI